MIREAIYMFIFLWGVFSTIIGGLDAKLGRCTYSSIASRISIPYAIGCEVFKERWR